MGANAISGFAQGISMLAIPWYFSDILKDNTTFGYMYAIATFFTLFWGLYAGTLIDKYSRKTLFLSLNVAGFFILGSVALCGFYLGVIPTFLIGLVFCATIFTYNLHYPTLYAFGQEISEKENYGKTNSLIEVIGQSTSVISGAFAAILLTGVNQEFLSSVGLQNIISIDIEKWKLHEIFLLDACTYALSFFLILFIKYQPIVAKQVDTGSILTRLKQGVSFLKKNPLLIHFGVASQSIFVILLIHIHQLMPNYVSNHLQAGSSVYAGAEMLYAAGALFSGLGIRWIFKNTNTIKATIILMLVSSLAFSLLAFTQSALILIIVCFVLGITNAGSRILRITYIFNHVPNHIIGRSGSVFQSVNIILRFTLISLFSLSFFSKNNNITITYIIGGAFVFVSIIPLILYYQKLINFKAK